MENQSFRRLGLMLDMSRNAVMKPEVVKDFIRLIAPLGYNALFLYTEDTYEIPDEPYFGYLRGRYTQKELKEIVRAGEENGVEVIPCIQTLAHLNAIVRWPRYAKICDVKDILMAGEEETYELIDKMFAALRSVYKTDLVNIGMDEAHMVGLGKYLDKHGFENRFEILTRHLSRVCQIAEKYGFHPMMWSDMFFRLANAGVYSCDKPKLPENLEKDLPADVSLAYWEYYTTKKKRLHAMMHAHQKLGREIWLCGGAWNWPGITPHNRFAVNTMRASIDVARKEGVKNVMFTLWGDDGGECSTLACLPSIFATALFARGVTDMKTVKEEFFRRYGVPYDAFLKLDLFGPKLTSEDTCVKNMDKVFLFQDPLLGIYDSTLAGDEAKRYASAARALAHWEKSEPYGFLFRKEKALCRVLALKADLGIRTRRAYQAGDKKELARLVEDYKKTKTRLREFIRVFRETWMMENKPHGFDVQELRLGGLMMRLSSAQERLEAHLKTGEAIPELDEEILDYYGGGKNWAKKPFRQMRYRLIPTVNPLSWD